jgi:hypothetical protein
LRLIFSRKGFDAGNGGVPSPILPDGRMIPLPIPSRADRQRLGALNVDGIDVGALAAGLSRNRVNAKAYVHVDPDLQRALLPRAPGWRPAFGQMGAAQSHLSRCGVGCGDLFLFFGWFRAVEGVDRHWRYLRDAPDVHALFGWLQVGEVIAVTCPRDVLRSHPWLGTHPHVASAGRHRSANNTIYVAADELRLGATNTGLPGGGVFERYSPALQLSAPGRSRSWWRLPAWFAPSADRPALSYHAAPWRWSVESSGVLLRVVSKGQEFVLDCDRYPEVVGWLAALFASLPRGARPPRGRMRG